MCDIPFSFSFCCTFSTDRVWFQWMPIVCRLSLSPLFEIASTTLSKQAGEDFQSAFLFEYSVFPQSWKLNALVLYLRADPKSSAVEQWMSQPSNISLSLRCSWPSQSVPTPPRWIPNNSKTLLRLLRSLIWEAFSYKTQPLLLWRRMEDN